MEGKANIVIPIVSKMYCSSSQVVLVVRRRPRVVYGGGLVVSDCTTQKVVFRVDGCGILGKKGELILRDGDGDPLLLIRRKGGIVEALNINRQWKGYAYDYEGAQTLVFSLKEPNTSCLVNNPIKISTEPKGNGTRWGFQVKGYFPDRACSIVDSAGNIIAQVGVKKEVDEMMTTSKDLYHVIVKPEIDQAFVFGVIGVLDYLYDGSTRC
ncbi:Protein LURP-one-related like [Actinidia chinensis var. chinensis]|uniref:Protein LURP-one-related like n=1 Tax=Actinidia chinensis var. chinensis TaxID=1590841 RepID=A0A2R6Q5M3_ACTCC|nr:Protein LURP-one-related like [Actinidia chinensis var. chinensis]PSS02031.1 Protein LURP-one-related like [Actinidia chinensis var. chinensis]